MPQRPGEFTLGTQQQALARQHHKCGSCGTSIHSLGQQGRNVHVFGEGAQGHHVRCIKFGGTDMLGNCVILCQSCHYSAHEGGNYRFGSVMGSEADFPYFKG